MNPRPAQNTVSEPPKPATPNRSGDSRCGDSCVLHIPTAVLINRRTVVLVLVHLPAVTRTILCGREITRRTTVGTSSADRQASKQTNTAFKNRPDERSQRSFAITLSTMMPSFGKFAVSFATWGQKVAHRKGRYHKGGRIFQKGNGLQRRSARRGRRAS